MVLGYRRGATAVDTSIRWHDDFSPASACTIDPET